MNILYLHQYFATPACNTGTRSFEMARRLVKDGHDVTFVTSSAFLDEAYELQNGWNYLEIEGIKLHVLKLTYSNKDSYITRIWKFFIFSVRSSFKSLSLTSDLVFATSTPLTIIIPAFICSKIKRIPLVFEVRDLWPELPIAVGAIKNPFVIFLAKALEKLAYSSAKKVIALSPGMAEGVVKVGVKKEDVIIIPNSCDLDLFRVPKEIGILYRERKLPFSLNKKLVVYTGTFGVINDVSYLVHLAKSSLIQGFDICFCAIGTGMEKDKVLKLAEELDVLNRNFFLLDPVPKTDIVSVLSAADLATSLFGPIPEMWANSANKMFDGLSSGTPVGINYKGWQYELLQKEGFGLYLDSENYEKAAQDLNSFLFDQGVYNLAVDRANYLAENDFSRDILYQEFKKVLLEVSEQ